MRTTDSPPLNQLLAALPADEYHRLLPDLTPRSLMARQRLSSRGEPLREVFFPGRSLCSLLVPMEDGATAEVAVVGSEGMVGVEAVWGLSEGICDAVVQIKGDGGGYAMSIDAFRRELDRRGALFAQATRYARALVGFVTQSVACHALHSADARCCRWLLHAQDRLTTDQIPLTHDSLSTLLGLRRPTVTLVVADLVQGGIISGRRGAIRINERAALEARSCECYGIVRSVFGSLVAVSSTQPAHMEAPWHASAAAAG